MIRLPHRESDFLDPRNPSFLVTPQIIGTCCVKDSVQRIEQPCRRAGEAVKVKVDFRKACELIGDDRAAIIWEVPGADSTDELEIEISETMKPPGRP